MIAVSDAVLIVVSVAVLSAGLFRWQARVEQATLVRQTTTQSEQAPRNSDSNSSQSINPDDSDNTSSNVIGAVETSIDGTTQVDIAQTATGQAEEEPALVVNDTESSNGNGGESDNGIASAGDSPIEDTLSSATYVVQEGDSLSRIAVLFNTSVSTLQEMNNIEGTLIRVGQTLRYPLPAN